MLRLQQAPSGARPELLQPLFELVRLFPERTPGYALVQRHLAQPSQRSPQLLGRLRLIAHGALPAPAP